MATFLARLLTDLRHAGRLLRGAPAFSIATVAILALAIGINTAMFSIVNTWMFRPLHFADANQLVMVLRYDLEHPDGTPFFAFARDHAEWKGRLQSFQNFGGMFWRSFTLTGRGEAESFNGMILTDDLFPTLGSAAELGRVFNSADLSGPPVIVLSHSFWQQHFAGSRDVLGRELALNGKPYRIIGVMPPSFSLRMENQPFDPAILALIQPGDADYNATAMSPLAIIGRLKPGVSIDAAKAELSALQSKLDATHTGLPAHMGILIEKLRDDNMRFVRTSIFTLAGAVVFVLLIACANVAGLLLGRTSTRRRELAVRAALGSGRGRLVSQLLTESLLLALIGAALGLLLAYGGVRGFVAINPFSLLPPDPISIDGRALGFAVALVFATTLLFGAAPALKASRIDPGEFLKSRGQSGAVRMRSGQSVLSVLQVALSLLLLTGAALMAKTLVKLRVQSLGYRTDQVTVAQLTLPGAEYGGHPDRVSRFNDRLLEKVAGLPGVQSAAMGSVRPTATGPGVYVLAEGQSPPAQLGLPTEYEQIVTPGFFDTLEIPLIAGRKFSERDSAASQKVAVVSDTLAQKLFGGADPIGRRIRIRKDGPWLTIVGMVASIRTLFYNTLSPTVTPFVFIPAAQVEGPVFNPRGTEAYLFLRGSGNSITMPVIRRQVDAVDRDVPMGDFMPLANMVAEATAQARMRTALVGGFAGVALLLAAIGIYGLIAQNTAQRTGEIGIRMALGARPGDVLGMVVRQAVVIAGVGIALGVAGGLALARVLAGFLYGIAATDATVYVAVAIAVIAAASAAAYLPARKAARVDPTVALRYE